ncbi:uncharacterized protein GGS22DRAFT_119316 [Annulohypoxylon maeteangense]|uniref:uncharacterized protein n=1 Tax=Annulohypoxylon maeteangense TaxID=1927788 RepID=UPI0020086856|nr:uncharacterized protein GGS22DRAFT_119316 [Annulohypoxylon maeteangense]KAI0886940.1 hypothetical protein GGS22DRAFT_119316 [Annulohypoxylon maeteangense]
MADDKSQDKVVPTSGEESKQADTGDNKKTEDTADSGPTTEQSRPPRQLPTHYRGMPKQWEKNQVPKKET